MVEVDEDLQPACDEVVRFSSLDVGDETDTARIMLVARVVEALSLRQSHRRMLFTRRSWREYARRAGSARPNRHNMHKIAEDANRLGMVVTPARMVNVGFGRIGRSRRAEALWHSGAWMRQRAEAAARGSLGEFIQSGSASAPDITTFRICPAWSEVRRGGKLSRSSQ
jgi:hypothetical protein